MVLCGTPWDMDSSMTWANMNHMGPYATSREPKHLDVSSTQLEQPPFPGYDRYSANIGSCFLLVLPLTRAEANRVTEGPPSAYRSHSR